jgi:hypothetical protein
MSSRFLLHRSSFRTLALLVTGAAFLLACTEEAAKSTKKKRTPVEPGDEYYDDDIPSQEQGLEPTSNEDSGAFGAVSERPAPAPKDAGGTTVDAGVDASDGGIVTKTFCTGTLALGDLSVSELLISSRAGSGDDGEWAEIKSTRTCWLRLQGLIIESPRGAAAPNTTTIAEDFELAPLGTFVVADSLDPAKNHALTGKVFAWGATDVLKNDGDTLTLKMGATVIDTLTYPAFSNLEPGRTLSFPSDCPTAVRADWERWSLSFDVWSVGFKGTPNAANGDVACY